MSDISNHHRDFSECKKQRKSHRARHHGQKQANQSRNNNNNSNYKDNHTNGSTSANSNGNHNNNNNSSQRCWDWMMVGGTNHYAKNRSAFLTYRRAPCKIGRTRILGVGTVKLDLVRSPRDPSTYTLILHDVLHIPDAVCNGISINPDFMGAGNYGISWCDKRIYDADTEEPCWYAKAFHDDGSMRCVLAGDPKGATFLEKNGSYALSVNASDGELGVLRRRVENRSLL